MKCKGCGGTLELTMSACPACGAAVELGRLTGILGIVCRACDAYNEPGARRCAACGKPLGGAAAPDPTPATPATAATSATAPTPTPAPPSAPAPAVAPPSAPGGRSFPRPMPGAATRFVPSPQHASAQRSGAARPALEPVPLVPTCPRCGARAGQGRFCASCGQVLGAHGTQVIAAPPGAGRSSATPFGALAPGRARLVLESGEGTPGSIFRLDAETLAAGRGEGLLRFAGDACLAPHHATLFFRDGGLHVRDEGAPGGVFLRLRGLSVPLRPGDDFAVGERLLRYAGPLPPAPTPPPDGTRRLGAPRPEAPAIVLEERLEGGVGGRVFVRGGSSVTIGRAGCAVCLGDDPHVSQAHAEILLDASGGARLKDLGSSNGTYLRLPARSERELHDGDWIRMGHEVLRVASG